jgi:hypothetical protein
MAQPDHKPPLQKFHSWAKDAFTMGCNSSLELDRPFIPTPKLQTHFQDLRHIQQLLEALFPDSELPVHPEEIQRKYSKVFAILLLIGRGKYIICFVQHDRLCDQYLPFRSRPTRFPTTSEHPDWFDSFCNRQWAFCTHFFLENMEKRFEPEEILPIIKIETLAEGTSAKTYKITLHESYNGLRSRDARSLVIPAS